MRNEWAGNAERAVLISELSGTNSKLRTLNSELGKAADPELGEAVDSELGEAADSELGEAGDSGFQEV